MQQREGEGEGVARPPAVRCQRSAHRSTAVIASITNLFIRMNGRVYISAFATFYPLRGSCFFFFFFFNSYVLGTHTRTSAVSASAPPSSSFNHATEFSKRGKEKERSERPRVRDLARFRNTLRGSRVFRNVREPFQRLAFSSLGGRITPDRHLGGENPSSVEREHPRRREKFRD